MKITLPLAALCLAAPLFLHAETITLANGTTVEGDVTKVEPHQLTVMTAGGIKKVPMEKLTADLQQKHGYDPAKASTYVTEQAAKARAIQEEQAKTLAVQQADKEKKEAVQAATTTGGPAASVESLSTHQDGNVEELRKELYTVMKTFADERKPTKGKSNSFWEWIGGSAGSPGYHKLKTASPIEETLWIRTADSGLYTARSLADKIKVSNFRQ